MKYKPSDEYIPQDYRADINEKILALVNSTDLQGITQQDVFTAYSGVGGLADLNYKDYGNYTAYADAKKEIENGQFFTPAAVADQVASLIGAGDTEFVCDLTFGAGVFFNSFRETNCYGCEIDFNAFSVAKFLYPLANIECTDIRFYKPPIKFDYVVGNPPFNIYWQIKEERIVSQLYFCQKASEVLKPGGLLLMVVPAQFLADDFFNKSAIASMDEHYNFLFQYALHSDTFATMGVKDYPTKVMCFQKRAESIDHIPYSTGMQTMEQAAVIMNRVQDIRHRLKVKLNAEFILKNGSDFSYRANKLLYEIKTHKVLKPHYGKAGELVEKFKTQVRPTDMEQKEWDRVKLTEKRVLNTLRRIVRRQNLKPLNKVDLVKSQYGFRLKAYSDKAKNSLNKKVTHVSFNELITGEGDWDFIKGYKPFERLAMRKRRDYELHTKDFKEFDRVPTIDTWLKRFAFISPKDLKAYQFNEKQFTDLGIILQKRYGILNWQQGCGKTAAAYAYCKFRKMPVTFIIGPAIAMDMTWVNFLKINSEKYVKLNKAKNLNKITPGCYVIASLEYIRSHERQIRALVKRLSYKATLVFDESDEITNSSSGRTKAVLSCFRRVKYKLLTTGTTTRNSIVELYSQQELLYNNSINMICKCKTYYVEETVKGEGTMIRAKENPYYMQPFPPFYGATTFKRCFNPSKSSVFGIAKHNQDIYNEEHLRSLIAQSTITRKFKDVAGDKYKVHTVTVQQTMAERAVYSKILRDTQEVISLFFNSTGSARKDAMLKMNQQMKLLIDATSMPQKFPFYHGAPIPNKAKEMINRIEQLNEKVAIGCTSIACVDWYADTLTMLFPHRQIFVVKGDVSFTGRKTIIKDFEDTTDGILVCTQQSLKSSVNIPGCNVVFLESKQWNIPKMEQFFFRFIRYDSESSTDVYFFSYDNTIEMNLLALLMTKEKLNDYIKTLEYREDSDIYDEFGIDLDILSSIMTKGTDADGKTQINWGKAEII